MIRTLLGSRLYLSATGVAMVFVVAVAYLFSGVLDQPLTSRPDEVKVNLTGTGGLYKGSAATYRGVKVGRVTDMQLTASGVVATVSLSSGTKVPAASLARVRSLSPVGEQFIDFVPEQAGGPYLQDGSVIEATATDLPQSLASTVVALNGVLRQIDDRKLRLLLGELSTGLAGSGDQIGRIVTEGDQVLSALDAAWPQTESLIDNSGQVLDIGTSQAHDLRTLGRNARQFTRFLRDYEPELTRTVTESPGLIATSEALVEEWGEVLPTFLPVANELFTVLAAYDPHLRELLARYASGIDTLGSLLAGGTLKLDLIFDREELCQYGTARRDPRDPDRRDLQTGGSCSGSQVPRGAAHAPGPVATH